MKNKKNICIISLLLLILLCFACKKKEEEITIDHDESVYSKEYNYGIKLIDDKNYDEAITVLSNIANYGDSKNKVSECKYNLAIYKYDEKNMRKR